ncbi:MAG: thioredoxin-disulfide reductase, partial [Pseudomonadota bacterium]
MESLAADLATMVRTPLHESHVALMRAAGQVKAIAAGTALQKAGDPSDTFYYVIAGEVEAVDPRTGGRYGGATLGPTQFFG